MLVKELQQYLLSSTWAVNEVERIDSFATTRHFLDELAHIERRQEARNVKSRGDAERIRWLMSSGTTRFSCLLHLQHHHFDWQRFTYAASNLGYGYLFYFICGNCERWARYLYRPSPDHPFFCRRCYHLKYRTKKYAT
jgi:hypothetical protein